MLRLFFMEEHYGGKKSGTFGHLQCMFIFWSLPVRSSAIAGRKYSGLLAFLLDQLLLPHNKTVNVINYNDIMEQWNNARFQWKKSGLVLLARPKIHCSLAPWAYQDDARPASVAGCIFPRFWVDAWSFHQTEEVSPITYKIVRKVDESGLARTLFFISSASALLQCHCRERQNACMTRKWKIRGSHMSRWAYIYVNAKPSSKFYSAIRINH